MHLYTEICVYICVRMYAAKVTISFWRGQLKLAPPSEILGRWLVAVA